MFRVIIAGGRDFDDYRTLEKTMDALLVNIADDIVIVCGMARGADALGDAPVAHHYEAPGDPPYVKYGCPVCETIGLRHQVLSCNAKCPNCGVNLLWDR